MFFVNMFKLYHLINRVRVSVSMFEPGVIKGTGKFSEKKRAAAYSNVTNLMTLAAYRGFCLFSSLQRRRGLFFIKFQNRTYKSYKIYCDSMLI